MELKNIKRYLEENKDKEIIEFLFGEKLKNENIPLIPSDFNYLIELININTKIQIKNQNVILSKLNQILDENIKLNNICKDLFVRHVFPPRVGYLEKFEDINTKLTELKTDKIELNLYNNERKE